MQESLKFNEVKKKNEKERKILFPSIKCNEELHLTKKSWLEVIKKKKRKKIQITVSFLLKVQ